MSIHNLIYKIKGKTGLDKVTLVYLFVIVGVGIASFGLGRISATDSQSVKSDVSITQKEGLVLNQNTDKVSNGKVVSVQPAQKKYVASKNGKMYYSAGCSGAKRIKPENQVWFATQSDAEKSGFSLSTTCK